MREMFWSLLGFGLAFALPVAAMALLGHCMDSEESRCAEFVLLPGQSCGAGQTVEVLRLESPEGAEDHMVCRCKAGVR